VAEKLYFYSVFGSQIDNTDGRNLAYAVSTVPLPKSESGTCAANHPIRENMPIGARRKIAILDPIFLPGLSRLISKTGKGAPKTMIEKGKAKKSIGMSKLSYTIWVFQLSKKLNNGMLFVFHNQVAFAKNCRY
jgi:hypothetical protein